MRGFAIALLRAIAVVLGVITLTFVLLHAAPGDPVQRLLGPTATEEQLARATATLGLDQPLATQYATWVRRAAVGDFGNSITEGRPVLQVIGEAWPATASLVVVSLTFSWLLGIVVGAWQAGLRSRSADGVASSVTIALHATPSYWLALVLVLVFTYELRWLPAFGASGLDADFLSLGDRVADRIRHAVLPVLTLTLVGLGGIARFVRGAMRDVEDADYLTMARARGVSRGRVVVRHQLRNALIPLIALLGLTLPALFSGTVFVEAIFAWPGVGQLLVRGVQARDYPLVMAAATVSATLVVAGNLAAELLLHWADPRTREAG